MAPRFERSMIGVPASSASSASFAAATTGVSSFFP